MGKSRNTDYRYRKQSNKPRNGKGIPIDEYLGRPSGSFQKHLMEQQEQERFIPFNKR